MWVPGALHASGRCVGVAFHKSGFNNKQEQQQFEETGLRLRQALVVLLPPPPAGDAQPSGDTKKADGSAAVAQAPVPVPVARFTHFISSSSQLPPTVVTPPSTLPTRIALRFSRGDLQDRLRGWWRELSEDEWALFIGGHPSIVAEESVDDVFVVLSRIYPKLSKGAAERLRTTLQSRKCVRTNQGMQFPQETYVKAVDMFADLPVCAFNPRKVTKQFLAFCGVRDRVDLALVFSRLSNLKWNSSSLIRFGLCVRVARGCLASLVVCA